MAKPTESDPLAETAAADGSDPQAVGVLETATGVPSGVSGPAPSPGGTPSTIGRYTIDGQLGQGGMGTVYAARDPDLDRRIALKVLRGVGSDPARGARRAASTRILRPNTRRVERQTSPCLRCSLM